MDAIFDQNGVTIGWLGNGVVYDRDSKHVAFINMGAVYSYTARYLGTLDRGFSEIRLAHALLS